MPRFFPDLPPGRRFNLKVKLSLPEPVGMGVRDVNIIQLPGFHRPGEKAIRRQGRNQERPSRRIGDDEPGHATIEDVSEPEKLHGWSAMI